MIAAFIGGPLHRQVQWVQDPPLPTLRAVGNAIPAVRVWEPDGPVTEEFQEFTYDRFDDGARAVYVERGYQRRTFGKRF